MQEGVQPAGRQDYMSQFCVLDVGDLVTYLDLAATQENVKRGVLYSMGGLLGEIILCFTTIQDYINSIPTFMNTPCFNSEQFELFLQHFMNQDVGRFNLILTKDLLQLDLNEDSD
jgi:hypothetical protein